MQRVVFSVFLLLTVGLISATAWAGSLSISDAWSPEAPPGRMMAGFMTLHNTGDQAIALVEAHSPDFGRVEIHTMRMDGDVMRMRRIEQLVIEPGQTMRLEPGGVHLMLMQPASSPTAGDTLAITLVGDSGQSFELTLTVKSRSR